MDPDRNLSEQLQIADRIVEGKPATDQDAARLAELVIVLNEWLVKGGFLPAAWRAGKRRKHP